MLCAKIGWNWLSGSGEEDFSNLSMYYCNFVIISPWKMAEPFIWTKMNHLHQGCFVPSLVEIGSGKEKCEKFTTTTDNRQILIRKAQVILKLSTCFISQSSILWYSLKKCSAKRLHAQFYFKYAIILKVSYIFLRNLSITSWSDLLVKIMNLKYFNLLSMIISLHFK